MSAGEAEVSLDIAMNHIRRLEFETALVKFRSVLGEIEIADAAWRGIAFCHMALGRSTEALEIYDRLLADGGYTQDLTMAALLRHRLGRMDEAVATYRQLLEACEPADVEILHGLQGLIFALRDAGRVREADGYAKQLVARYRADPAGVATTLADRNNTVDFHEWSRYGDKGQLAQSFRDAGIAVPESFVLPDDRAALLDYAKQAEGPIFIVKPRRGSGGQGIFLTDRLDAILDLGDVVVQRYLDRPLLLDGKKAHLRVYGLITSVAPLTAHIYEDGIVRLAPERYERGEGWLERIGMHITNTALHIGHPGLILSDDPAAETSGNIWTLRGMMGRLKTSGFDTAAISAAITDLVRQFLAVLTADGVFERQAANHPPRAYAPKLFGLDVLLDEQGKPWLIEMQRKPALAGTPLVEWINGELCAAIFKMSCLPVIPESGTSKADDLAWLVKRERAMEAANRGLFSVLG